MKRKMLAAAVSAAVMLAMSGCAFEEMLGQLDSALESVSYSDSSSAEDTSADETTDKQTETKNSDSREPSKAESSSEAVSESSSSEAEPLGEVDEARFTANAKAVITSYFGLMGAAQYTDAFRLCTKDFIEKNYPQGLTDGKNASPVTVGFYEGTEDFDTDDFGRRRIRLTVSIAPEGKEDSAFDCYMYVVISDETFLISETKKVGSDEPAYMGGMTQENVELFARYVYDCTNIYIAMLEPGVYETGDGSELDKLIPEYTPGGHYLVTIGNEGVESVVYTVNGLTVTYP